MKLNYKIEGQGPGLVILHGLFGSLDNWQTLARRWSNHFEVISVDQRNHGRSGHSDQMGYDYMSEDLNELLSELNKDKVAILGHSMGGKTAMQFAIDYPDKVSHLFVLDIAPKEYPPHHQKVISGLRKVKLESIESRKEAEEQMAGVIPEIAVRQFLLKNLYRIEKDRFDWRMNLDVLEDNVQLINASISSDKSIIPATFIKGDHSGYISEEDEIAIKYQFLNAEFINLPAGHWLHAELPNDIYRIIMYRLS